MQYEHKAVLIMLQLIPALTAVYRWHCAGAQRAASCCSFVVITMS